MRSDWIEKQHMSSLVIKASVKKSKWEVAATGSHHHMDVFLHKLKSEPWINYSDEEVRAVSFWLDNQSLIIFIHLYSTFYFLFLRITSYYLQYYNLYLYFFLK